MLLAGCAGTGPLHVETVEVDIPIAVPCKQEPPTPPDYCFVKLATESDIFIQVQCLLSDRKLSLGYETELLAGLNACIK